VPTRRILHTRLTPQPATRVKQTLSTQCTRKTYPTGIINSPDSQGYDKALWLVVYLFAKSITKSGSSHLTFINISHLTFFTYNSR
jgi:hypothetical protein